MGVFPQADFRVEQIVLQMGDFLMGYTDGTTDARNEDDEIFSEERLMNYIQYPWSSLFSMVFEVKNELHRFAGPHQQFDDITIISMRSFGGKIPDQVRFTGFSDAASMGMRMTNRLPQSFPEGGLSTSMSPCRWPA